MSDLKIGDILIGYYVDNSPRYYKIIKITPQKIKVLRLASNSKGTGPGSKTFGEEKIFTKKDKLSAYHQNTFYNKLDIELIETEHVERNELKSLNGCNN
jgi:hypothetical protein